MQNRVKRLLIVLGVTTFAVADLILLHNPIAGLLNTTPEDAQTFMDWFLLGVLGYLFTALGLGILILIYLGIRGIVHYVIYGTADNYEVQRIVTQREMMKEAEERHRISIEDSEKRMAMENLERQKMKVENDPDYKEALAKLNGGGNMSDILKRTLIVIGIAVGLILIPIISCTLFPNFFNIVILDTMLKGLLGYLACAVFWLVSVYLIRLYLLLKCYIVFGYTYTSRIDDYYDDRIYKETSCKKKDRLKSQQEIDNFLYMISHL